ncbi:MAG: hypothetical protein GY750_07330 [Lentisphaerae bacterium]|nr:hypothetical protein [Lentisphaerota bacterium]MCP4101221.1 hypothetical protein [Lentisphaerota bacterium]
MKITEDIIKALQNCIDAIGSISDFSQQANVNIETLSKYMSRKSQSIRQDTWEKLYPLIQAYLPKSSDENESKAISYKPKSKSQLEKYASLTSDEKILLDAFSALPMKIRNQKLLEIVELARQQVVMNKEDE